MTFVFGRRRLIVSLLSEQPETVDDLYPVAYLASDKELMKLNKLASSAAERVSRDVNVVMYGAGWFR